MIKNFIVKKGDQLSFTITFNSSTPVTNIEWGIKKDYADDQYTILKTLNNGITKLTDTTYAFVLTSDDTNALNYLQYPYDIRININGIYKTPLSGKLFIKETVFKAV